jgi:DNA-binding XRE family transcriptional regulator
MAKQRRRPAWDAGRVRALRQHLGLTQVGLSAELGVRQQTVSEWETGAYQPRGASARLLTLVAERAGFDYDVSSASGPAHEGPPPRGIGASDAGDGRDG